MPTIRPLILTLLTVLFIAGLLIGLVLHLIFEDSWIPIFNWAMLAGLTITCLLALWGAILRSYASNPGAFKLTETVELPGQGRVKVVEPEVVAIQGEGFEEIKTIKSISQKINGAIEQFEQGQLVVENFKTDAINQGLQLARSARFLADRLAEISKREKIYRAVIKAIDTGDERAIYEAAGWVINSTIKLQVLNIPRHPAARAPYVRGLTNQLSTMVGTYTTWQEVMTEQILTIHTDLAGIMSRLETINTFIDTAEIAGMVVAADGHLIQAERLLTQDQDRLPVAFRPVPALAERVN